MRGRWASSCATGSPPMLRIGFVGLALSHPYTFAQVMREKGIQPAYVYDENPVRAAEFAAQFGAELCATPAAMAARRPDGAMICGVAANHLQESLPFLEAGIPTFIDRPLAVSHSDLTAIRQGWERGGGPLLCTSILRYAEAFAPLREAVRTGSLGTILGASATICHSIEVYLKPGNTWQDEPERGGGTIMTMGQHGLELLASTLGVEWRSLHALNARRHLRASRSEDMALLSLQYADGALATLHLVAGSKAHGYSLTLYGSEGSLTANAPSGAAELLADYGYTGTVDAFRSMIESRQSPVPPAEIWAIAESLLKARAMAAPAPD